MFFKQNWYFKLSISYFTGKKNPHFKILQFVQANKIVFYYNSTLVKKQNWEEEAAEEKSEN